MKRAISYLAAVSYAVLFLLSVCHPSTAYAGTSLPDGTVKGLPDGISVLDESGKSVNEQGEYFLCVENMAPGEVYEKNVHITNLQTDTAFHLYMYAEPVSDEGNANLEENCELSLALGGNEIFKGKVSGEPGDGYNNMAETPLDLGTYLPGDNENLNITVFYNGEGSDGVYDHGSYLVDVNGTHTLREEGESVGTQGTVTFKWIFYAVKDDSYVPPNTGLTLTRVLLVISAGITAAVIVFLILVINKNKKSRKNEKA